MNEREAEAFLRWAGWPDDGRYYCGDRCTCFRGSYWEPPAICGYCERASEIAEEQAEAEAFVDELEFERDLAFEQLIGAI